MVLIFCALNWSHSALKHRTRFVKIGDYLFGWQFMCGPGEAYEISKQDAEAFDPIGNALSGSILIRVAIGDGYRRLSAPEPANGFAECVATFGLVFTIFCCGRAGRSTAAWQGADDHHRSQGVVDVAGLPEGKKP
jgi:hypothetical protein